MAIAGNKTVFFPNILFLEISAASSSNLKIDEVSTIKSILASAILSISLDLIFKMSDTFSFCPSKYT